MIPSDPIIEKKAVVVRPKRRFLAPDILNEDSRGILQPFCVNANILTSNRL
jgi:hypothetical protein